MMQLQIKRSSTGVYHLGSDGGSTSNCNGRSGRFSSSTVDNALKAKESSFCKKCFGEDPFKTIYRLQSNGRI